MQANKAGIDLIKSFEGCRLSAYKPVAAEIYWTIGYGHCGPDVKQGMKITQNQAEEYLKKDLQKFEKYVTDTKLNLNENEFSALVSFTYNAGKGNLQKLIKNRTKPQIAEALLLYNKGSGKVLAGLTKRRKAERELFLKPIIEKIKEVLVEKPKETKPKEKKEIKELPCEVKALQDFNAMPAAGTNYTPIRKIKKGEKIKIWAVLTNGSEKWGKNGKEFYNLKYCEVI